MQHLNIPLSRSSQTTRRTRWVVWLLVLSVASIIIATYWISALWFTRDTIYNAAPEHTVMAARFFTSGNKGAYVESIFEHLPLVSNRTLTFSDLAPYISGEFAVFFSEDNSRFAATRLTNTPLPHELFDSESIIEQPFGKNIVLLSEKPEVVKTLGIKPKFLPGFSFPGHTWIGEIIDTSVMKRSFIYATSNRVDISLAGPVTNTHLFKQFPEGTIAYLSTPVLTNQSEDLFKPVLPLMQFIADPNVFSSMKHIADEQSRMILSKDEKGLGFFITSNQPDDKKTPDLEQVLRTIAALNTPKIQETLLDDGSSIKEIIANPDSISVEEITVLGTQIYRIHTNNGELLAGFLDKNNFFLTNRESLFRSFKGQNTIKTQICSGNIAGISFRALDQIFSQHASLPNSNAILLFSQNFSSMGVKTDWFSTKITLCH